MTALWLLIPSRVKLYAAIFVVALLAFLRYRNNIMAEAVNKYALEVEDADAQRAANTRDRVRNRMLDANDGYRD